jgi:ribonuclease E
MSSYTTRSGRVIKKPVLYEPQEIPEDDFKPDEYDEDTETDDDDDIEDDDDDDDDEDADENGNLKDFVVEDDEDEECD